MERRSEGLVRSQESSPSVQDCQTSPQASRTLQDYKGTITHYIPTRTPVPIDHPSGVPCIPADPVY